MAKVRHYYVSGNTSLGYYSIFDSLRESLNSVYILKGAPGAGVSQVVKDIAEHISNKGYSVELIHSTFDSGEYEGVIIPELKTGIIDGSYPRGIDAKFPSLSDEVIDLNQYINSEKVKLKQKELRAWTGQMEKKLELAYTHFANAKKVHFDKEDIYVDHMNFTKADEVTEQIINSTFNEEGLNKQGQQRHLFFGAATDKGVDNYIDNLTEGLSKRIIIKGRSGSGKSTMLRKIVAQATEKGYDSEVYHCGFDPNSLDMVILPELSFAILDGTAPHVIDPSRSSDQVVDMYEICFDHDVDSQYSEKLSHIAKRYAAEIKIAVQALKEAKTIRDKVKEVYASAIDYNQIENVKQDLIGKVLA